MSKFSRFDGVAFKLLVLFALLMFTTAALAVCTSHSFIGPNGRMTVCTTCCVDGTCNTVCF